MSFRFHMYICLYSPSLPQISIFGLLILVAVNYTAKVGFWLAVSYLHLYYERVLLLESSIKHPRLSYINSFSVAATLSTLSILL